MCFVLIMTSNLSHCRLCGEHKKAEHLVDMAINQKRLEDFYKKLKIFRINFFDLSSNILPKTLCMPCNETLQNTFDFYNKMKNAQKLLHNLYKSEIDTNTFEVTVKLEKDENNEFHLGSDHPIELNPKIKEDQHVNTDLELRLKKFESGKVILSKTSEYYQNLNKNLELDKTSTVLYSRTKNNSFISSNEEPVSLSELENKSNKIEMSWTDYDWSCMHCHAKFDSMAEVRDHSKILHATCYGFQCVDCTELFNYFNPFVEHVRQHIESLRLYCQFCNQKSSSPDETIAHAITHWSSAHICDLCGENLPSVQALQRHKKVYRKAVLPQRCYKKKPRKVKGEISWKEYAWTCQDCQLPAADAAALRLHTRAAHRKCFSMKCADCLAVMTNFKQFVDHATQHRDTLKNYCPYCNAHCSDETSLKEHITTHISGAEKLCSGCGDIFANSSSLAEHMTLYDAPRVRGNCDSESLTCGVCCKKFPNAFQLRNHKVIHNEKRERDQICHTCGKAFFDTKTLTNHIRTHFNNTETCEICKKTFLTKQRLKVHISTHLEEKQFVCDDCGKKFRRKSQLRLHLASHSDVLPFQCETCSKSFRMQSYLKIHARQHTGVRPYTCEVCRETFNHWGNCNRHMIRKHGVTFAKTKITAHGKLDINPQTGEAKRINIGGDVKDWCDEMLKPKKRGRKKKDAN